MSKKGRKINEQRRGGIDVRLEGEEMFKGWGERSKKGRRRNGEWRETGSEKGRIINGERRGEKGVRKE
jgi:hypothetical protein